MIIKVKSNENVRPSQELAVSFIQLDEYDNLLKLELVNNVRHGTYFSKYNINRYLDAIRRFDILGKGSSDDFIKKN